MVIGMDCKMCFRAFIDFRISRGLSSTQFVLFEVFLQSINCCWFYSRDYCLKVILLTVITVETVTAWTFLEKHTSFKIIWHSFLFSHFKTNTFKQSYRLYQWVLEKILLLLGWLGPVLKKISKIERERKRTLSEILGVSPLIADVSDDKRPAPW